jgi:regulator of nucleoside diphosphate kinase
MSGRKVKEVPVQTRDIYITEHDLDRLLKLTEAMASRDRKSGPYIEKLEEQLDRAHVVEPGSIPADVITMNSTVRLQDLNSKEELTYKLVFPGNANAGLNAISVLAPIGTALLGYREGDVIEWDVPAGIRRLKVLEVVYQPERIGDFQS